MHCKDTILRTQNNWPYSKLIPNSGILDIMKNTKLSNGAKALWIAIILLFQIIGAAIYYLLAPRDNPPRA